MSTQTEALRLANSLDARSLSRHGQIQAAAELRRLSIENEALGLHLSERMKDLARVEAQRDALLEACKVALGIVWFGKEYDQIAAAIKQAEENK